MTIQEFQHVEEGHAPQLSQTEENSHEQNESQSSRSVFEIAILARVKWNLHSLNNEGTIGNVTEPRTIVLWDGTKTDGVSGEMMKHIHAYWSWLLAMAENRALCPACKSFQPQRADAAPQGLNQSNNVEAMNTAITRCVLCDLHGFLVQRPTINRQSVVEFGWIVGVPGNFNRDIHTHARHSAAERGISEDREHEEGETLEEQTQEQHTGSAERSDVPAQMVYHRPTRSGVYALVTLFQPWRIGLNEVNYTYALPSKERSQRYQLALRAYEWTLNRPDGAMITTRFPHIEGTEGVVLISSQVVPVPTISPLRDDYLEVLKNLAEIIEGIEYREFRGFNELVKILSDLRARVPYQMPFINVSSGDSSAPTGDQQPRTRRRRSNLSSGEFEENQGHERTE